ncbi:hypothetical protein DM02DRAFT_663844, partial [Periconia macrospinosa]
LLDCPPELLIHTLGFLPVRELLRFSQTCQYSRSLATASLHTLSLGVHYSRIAATTNRLVATRYPQPQWLASFFPPQNQRSDSTSRDLEHSPYRASLWVPGTEAHDYPRLLNRKTALILERYGTTLRTLDLCLWMLPQSRKLSPHSQR